MFFNSSPLFIYKSVIYYKIDGVKILMVCLDQLWIRNVTCEILISSLMECLTKTYFFIDIKSYFTKKNWTITSTQNTFLPYWFKFNYGGQHKKKKYASIVKKLNKH